MRLVKLIDIAEIKPFDCGDDGFADVKITASFIYNLYTYVGIVEIDNKKNLIRISKIK